MTTEITETAPQFTAPEAGQASEQTHAAEAFLSLIQMFPTLPRPYVTLSSVSERFDLQLDHPSHFEAWRTALQLPHDTVTLHAHSSSVWLFASGVFHGVAFHLTGFDVPLTAEQARTSQAADKSAPAVAA